ncbi:MAG: GNAT family N-acetyltransferase [Planctomycetes bacterium]|nr:GNAT family N-acetyltransferase [Planctomycetota bacterium]
MFHLAGWRRAVTRVFRHENRDLLAFRGAELVGVLPLMRCRTPFLASHLISVPYGVYGGPLGADRDVEHALVAEARALARRLGVGRLELRCFEDPGVAELVPSTLYSAFLQKVPSDPTQVMAAMPKRARAEARKAIEKHHLELSEGEWYLGDLVELFGAAKQGLGSPGLPRAWFEALMEELPGKVVLHLARKGDLRLAATMSFVSNGVFSFYYIGNTPEANREYSATNFLTVRLQEWCATRGIPVFDLGRSRLDTGPYQFKKNQGFEPTPLAYRYDLVQAKELPSFNPSNPRTAKLRETWAKLPPAVARLLSGRLMRYLP